MLRNNEGTPSNSAAQNKFPAAPPPPYTEFAAGPPGSSSGPFSATAQTPLPNTQYIHPAQIHTGVPMSMPHAVPHPGYGPTPLATNQPLLPYAYYAPRGSADARARWRFFWALVWAVGLWMFCGFIVGVEIWGDDGWVWTGWAANGGLDGVVRTWLKLKVTNGAVALA